MSERATSSCRGDSAGAESCAANNVADGFSVRRILCIWVAVAAVVFCGLLGRARIASSHESRVVETAQTMIRAGWPWEVHGMPVPPPQLVRADGESKLVPVTGAVAIKVNPWIVPIYRERIRLQKPPLPYWITATAFGLLGEGAAVARLVPALAGTAGTLLIFLLARQVGERRNAVLAAVLWVSSFFVISEYRKAMADPYLGLATLLAISLWAAACSPVLTRRLRHAVILAFYAAIAAGALAKGPVIFLHAAAAAGSHAVCLRRWPGSGIAVHVAGGVLLASLLLPWPAYVAWNLPGAVELWRYESVGAFADNVHHARPWYYYLGGVLLISVPWTLPWLVGIVAAVRRPRSRRLFPVLWLAVTVLVLSLSHVKKNAYLLPALPAVVLTSVHGLARVAAVLRRGGAGAGLTRAGALAHGLAGIVAASAIVAVTCYQRVRQGQSGHLWWTFMVGGGGALVLLSCLSLWLHRQRRHSDWLHTQAFVFAVITLFYLTTAVADRHSWRQHEPDPFATPPSIGDARDLAPFNILRLAGDTG